MEKQNLTQQKHTFINQKKCITTQNKHEKLKPALVTSYDIRPVNGQAHSYFGASEICHLLTYLLRQLPTYLQPCDPHGADDGKPRTNRLRAEMQLDLFSCFDMNHNCNKKTGKITIHSACTQRNTRQKYHKMSCQAIYTGKLQRLQKYSST